MSGIRLLLTLCILAPLSAFPQQRGEKEIRKKEQELQKLRSDIQAYERKLHSSEVREQSTLDVLDDLENQSNLIRKLIKSLKEEEVDITAEIRRTRESVSTLELQLQHLRTHYAGYICSIYKHGRVYDLELLFSSNSVNQLSIRIEYLRKFSQQRARDLTEIQQKKSALENENDRLEKSLLSERQILAEKTREERNLKEKLADRKSVLRSIRRNKAVYRKALTRKSAAASQVENLIADLIVKEQKRKEQEAAEERERSLAAAKERDNLATTSAAEPRSDVSDATSEFEQLKGKLRWPVASGSIPKEGKFGKHIHPDLKTVTQNTGIDINTKAGSNVFAVANGEVAALSFIPGFGNILIINNYSGYHTVYAHLADISVSKSDKVSAGEVIAHSGESIDGSLLHFEIWKERDKLNPETWLAKRK
ncbi:MAG TPA: peptidoglycan DD-metalloendopeptidase family protein [Bacteroidota bacterium]